MKTMQDVDYFDKSNSSSGRWVIKFKDQNFEFYWHKSEMLARLEELDAGCKDNHLSCRNASKCILYGAVA